ncbi:GGDEF domain-containing protein [Treponema ruminis]|uniref:Diguanylate cyclase (GGDEF)-like protein n=1 Tax=Treponema ruminis TaxID=744515 RepID=A0A7W8LLW2_9SPIR|nr:GGDEF domain-containing protein [Treponema ruminis]MBB5225886.1 diguanylate cyclase (GGDEF)-like protein [Treponema ruminis]QSI03201.1 GGDEF domain-containing protein [Treponema ruminis]
MKTIFVILMGITLAFFPVGVKKLFFKKDSLSKRMLAVLVPASFSLIAHCILLFVTKEFPAYLVYAFYFAFANWMSVGVLAFCVCYTNSDIHNKVIKFFVVPVSIIDTLLLFANVFNHFLFTIHKIQYGSGEFFRYSFSLFLVGRLVFTYGLFVYSFIIILKRFLKEPPTLRVKYYSFLIYLALITFINILYLGLDSPYNYSIIVYAFCFISSYNVLNRAVPNILIQHVLGRIADELKNGIVLLDNDGLCIYVNAFVKQNFECGKDEILHNEVFADYFSRRKEAILEPMDSFSCEVEYQSERKRLTLNICDYIIKDGESIVGRYYLIEDITALKNQAYEEKLLRTRDPLTELYNKEYFFEKVAHRLKYDRFTKYYLIISDIVNFKLVNDLHGKPFGDTILRRSADAIRKYAARDVIYGRLYNDHFIMLVPKRRFDEEVYANAFKNDMSYLQNFSYNLIIHMGLYEIDDLTMPVPVMCDRAFLALRSIKNDYKTAFAYYDDHLRQEVLKLQMLMNELPVALKTNQLKMYLQPQVTKNGTLVGAEALVRWHHPIRGIIPPGEFIEIIEKINIISDVDRYIWECACAKLAEWKRAGKTNLTISVNISARDFFTMNLLETLVNLIKKYEISPKSLNLEITETAVIYDVENQLNVLDKLRELGFIVEMDDFGSGYSSLNMLKDIAVDVLKIDMAFLQKSKDDAKSHKILEKIIILAKELGMKVLTEGVESDKQIDFLSAAGCDLFQGYYFSRPVPVNEFEEKYFR